MRTEQTYLDETEKNWWGQYRKNNEAGRNGCRVETKYIVKRLLKDLRESDGKRKCLKKLSLNAYGKYR
jgi:hypothetical protein